MSDSEYTVSQVPIQSDSGVDHTYHYWRVFVLEDRCIYVHVGACIVYVHACRLALFPESPPV